MPMTPEKVAERRRQEQAVRESEWARMSEATRALLEANPPRARGPKTCREEIADRFAADHGSWPPFICSTAADFESQMGGLERWCAHHGLLALAAYQGARPGVLVADIVGRYFRADDFDPPTHGLRSLEIVQVGDETGPCACPHDCGWIGPLRDMWIQGGTIVCPNCHEACPI